MKKLWGMLGCFSALALHTVTAIDTISDDTSIDLSTRKKLEFIELVEFDGYNGESHNVTTKDGYILTVHRVLPNKKCKDKKSPPIIFMHGLYLSSDDCLIPGPGVAHCYIYADDCYDVWVPNNRGNKYSRSHTYLNPDTDPEFWNFAFDEIALLDLPAVIDYVLNKTAQSQVTFIGHSQGVTVLLYLCAKRAEYNNKINIGIGLSTTAWLDHSRFIVITLQSVLAPLITVANNIGINREVLANGGLAQTFLKDLCGDLNAYLLCSAAYFSLLGYNNFQITKDVLPMFVTHEPSGTSLKNFGRWGQIRINGFSEYDYGPSINLQKYGNLKPPLIDLKNVTMPWIFIASRNDYVGEVKDLETLVPKLANVKKTCILKDETFGHLDFLYGKDIPNYITPTILDYLNMGDIKCL